MPASERPLLAIVAVDDSTIVFQEKAMQQMGRGSTGPADTVGDGECLFRSFSQQQAAHNCDRGTAWAMQNSEQAQLGFAAARLRAADALQHTPDITTKVIAHAAQIVSCLADYKCLVVCATDCKVGGRWSDPSVSLDALQIDRG